MRKRPALLLILLSILTLAAHQEIQTTDFTKVFGLPPFVFRALQFPSGEQTEALVQVKIGLVNDILQFVKRDDGTFEASYELTLDLLDSSGTIISEKALTNRVSVNDFEASNSRRSHIVHAFDFFAPAGPHSFHLEIIDSETRKRLLYNEKLDIKSFRDDHQQFSSIVFLNQGADDEKLRYNLTETYVNEDEQIAVLFALSGVKAGQPLELRYVLKEWDDSIVQSWQETITPEIGMLQLTRNITEHVPYAGNYTLEVSCQAEPKAVEIAGRFSVKFQPGQGNGASEAPSADKTYLALKYLCSDDEYQQIINSTGDSQETHIAAFWEPRDPTPNTAANELRDEFDRRTQFANLHFSIIQLKMQGWETDRGKIYILNGPPTWVRSQSNEFGRPPIEIWYYKSLDIRYVFRDKKGDGNYKLIHQE